MIKGGWKGLDRVQEMSHDDASIYMRQLDHWTNRQAARIAKDCLVRIQNHHNSGYAIIDDEIGDLVAVCAYDETHVAEFVNQVGMSMGHITTYADVGYATPAMWIVRLAGNGRNAAFTIMKDLMQVCVAENRLLMLESEDEAMGFYEKLGLTLVEETRNSSYPVYIYAPPSMRIQ